jgi:hypothetical protein
MVRIFLYSALIISFLLGLVLGIGVARADYPADKEACEAVGKLYHQAADLRRSYTLSQVVESVLSREENDAGTVALLRIVYFVYAHPKVTPEQFERAAFQACMKQKGHISASYRPGG